MKKNYFKSLMQASLLLGAAFVISSCDDVIGQEDNPVASYVQWDAKTPKSIELTLGITSKETFQIKAIAVSSATIVYESENTEIAKVNPVTGEITAVGVGETFIKAVISGASSAGQSVFIPEEIKIPVVVRDGKAKLTRVQDEVIEYTANKDSIIDLQKLFTAYPKVGDGDANSSIEFKLLGKNSKNVAVATGYADGTYTNIAYISNKKLKITNGYSYISQKSDADISDTVYVAAKINKFNSNNEYIYNAKATEDTVMVVINKSIAYINKEGKREILTADKFKELPAGNAIEAGTYYVKNTVNASDIAVKGDVTLIFANSMYISSITDETDNATLNIFGEAKQDGNVAGKYKAYNPYISVYSNNGNAISNFATINIYTGEIYAMTGKTNTGAIVKVKNLNVLGGKLVAGNNSGSGYAISLPEGGKLTVNGGEVEATGVGSDSDYSYAIIGNVDVLKGKFTATSDAYRAVSGNLTKGEGIKLYNADDAEITTATSNSKRISTTKTTTQVVVVPVP